MTDPMQDTPPCSSHPDAPHGFNRQSSHNADRYVCDCEGWSPKPSDVDTDTRERERELLEELMESVQVYASAWSLVGGKLDKGQMRSYAEEAKKDVRDDISRALAQPTPAPLDQRVVEGLRAALVEVDEPIAYRSAIIDAFERRLSAAAPTSQPEQAAEPSPDDEFETRADGKRVRKDRWEWGIRRIVALLWGNRHEFEVDEVVEAVRKVAPSREDAADDEGLVRGAEVGFAPSTAQGVSVQEPSVEAAARMGASGSPAVEAERLAFEAWVRGHCWGLGCDWTGTQYLGSRERDGNYVCPVAMQTRRMWAAWRDRAALTTVQSTEAPKVDSVQEPVAVVHSKFGDPEAFGEREIVVLTDLRKIPYNTKLYATPPEHSTEARDAARLMWVSLAMDGSGDHDFHADAAEHAALRGAKTTEDADYLHAVRIAIDAAMSAPPQEPTA